MVLSLPSFDSVQTSHGSDTHSLVKVLLGLKYDGLTSLVETRTRLVWSSSICCLCLDSSMTRQYALSRQSIL